MASRPKRSGWGRREERSFSAIRFRLRAALLDYARKSESREFIVVTESGILHEMQKACPEKEFIAAPAEDSECQCNECEYMKLNTLEKVAAALRNESPEIEVDEEIAEAAMRPIRRMLELS